MLLLFSMTISKNLWLTLSNATAKSMYVTTQLVFFLMNDAEEEDVVSTAAARPEAWLPIGKKPWGFFYQAGENDQRRRVIFKNIKILNFTENQIWMYWRLLRFQYPGYVTSAEPNYTYWIRIRIPVTWSIIENLGFENINQILISNNVFTEFFETLIFIT